MSKRNYKKGFGLIEVLLSAVIIIMMLSALVFLARTAISNSIHMQERAAAINLAQEGMEVVRQVRDSNYIDKKSETQWNTFIGSASDKQPSSGTLYGITNDLDVSGRFRIIDTYSVPIVIDNTTYYRTVQFTTLAGKDLLGKPTAVNSSGNNAYMVSVKVYWPQSPASNPRNQIEIKELITNSRFVY